MSWDWDIVEGLGLDGNAEEGRKEELKKGRKEMGMSLGCKDKPKVAWGGERRVSSAISLYSRKCGASILLIPKHAVTCIVHPLLDSIVE